MKAVEETKQDKSEAPKASPAKPTPTSAGPTGPSPGGELTGQLKWYYARVFPLEPFTRWLRYGRDDNLGKREISFTLPGDIYLRWKSFNNAEAFREALNKSAPVKIDIGAIYNFSPADRNSVTGTLTPVAKEVVFDIDMTDYEDVLGSMGGGSAVDECDRCWSVMATAVRVIDRALRDDFGFKHIMWVYSGRRGVHCWVGDSRARRLTNEQRSAVADFLHVRFEGRENAGRRQTEVTVPMHPSLTRARRMCEAPFQDFSLRDAGVLDNAQGVRACVASIPSQYVVTEVETRLGKLGDASGAEKWKVVERAVSKAGRSDWGVRGACDYIVLRHVYPRLDVNVSREINHLLKAPFSVHPKTGRVCVPFFAEEVEDFRPERDAPVLSVLLAQLDSGDGEASQKMKKAVKVFEDFVNAVEMEAREELKVEKLDRIDRNSVKELVAF